MAFKMKYKNLEGVVGELRNAVKAHGKQADTIEKHIDEMKESPMKKYVSDAQRKAVHASKNEKGFTKMDPMYNGKPGVQKEDFKQFSSPMSKKAKGMDGKACWKGYKLQGTKMKGGKRVDNCVKM